MNNHTKRLTLIILIVGDFIALLLFVFIGQRDHETLDAMNPLLGSLLLTGEFALPWLIAGWLLGAFQLEPREGRRATFFARTLNAWLVAAPIGILIRALVLGRAVIPTSFLIVAMSLGGVFVFAWRVLFVIAERFATRRLEPST